MGFFSASKRDRKQVLILRFFILALGSSFGMISKWHRPILRSSQDWSDYVTSTGTEGNVVVVVVVVVDRFYIALFSALEQTHCALVACDFE